MLKTSEIYKKVYHYTTWDGLLGILQTQNLWATHYKFLSDYSEITLFRDKLISFTLPYVRKAYEAVIKNSPEIGEKINQEGGLNQFVKHDTELFVDTQYQSTGDEIYIVSFCGEHKEPNINRNGLLSQWRGYGAGGGFALVFDTQILEEMLEEEGNRYEYSVGHIADLVYSDDEDKLKKELSDNLSILADGITKLIENAHSSNRMDLDLSDCYLPFVSCITRYKHYGFREENEVRIVALPTVLDQRHLEYASSKGASLKPEKERKFRNKNYQHIPYIELFDLIETGLPIEKIIVGPHKEKEIRASTLRVMLSKTSIEIACSDIPYVG